MSDEPAPEPQPPVAATPRPPAGSPSPEPVAPFAAADGPSPASGPSDLERARAARMAALGLAAMTAGVAAAVARYVFLPLELGGHWNAVLVGGAAGLAAAGFQQFRMGRKRGGRLAGRQALLSGLLPPVVVVALFALAAPLLDPLDDALLEREFPGLVVPLPDWEVIENSTNGPMGVARLRVPHTRNGYLQVRRMIGPLPKPDDVARVMQLAGSVRIRASVDAEADGRPARIHLVADDSGGRLAAMGLFDCPATGLSVLVWLLAGDAESDELVGFLRRVLAGARCVPLPEGTTAGSRFPQVRPPEGWRPVENPALRLWQGPLGDVLAFTPGTPDPKLPATLRERPGMVAELMRMELSLRDARADPEPLPMPGDDGRPRDVWSGSGTLDDGASVRFLLAVWNCPDGLACLGYYAGPADAPREEALRALRTAACP